MKPDEDIYYVRRLRYVHGLPLCIEISYYKKSIVTYLNDQIVSESIFSYIQEALNLKIGFSDNFFHVRKLRSDEAELLGLTKGDPTLQYESIYHLPNGEVFNFSKIVYNYNEAQFYLQVNNF